MSLISAFVEGVVSAFELFPTLEKNKESRKTFVHYRLQQIREEQLSNQKRIDEYLGNDTSLNNAALYLAHLFNNELEKSIIKLPNESRAKLQAVNTSHSHLKNSSYEASPLNKCDSISRKRKKSSVQIFKPVVKYS